MKRFEYKIIHKPQTDFMWASELSELGALGWELVSITVHDAAETFYFKRQVV